MLRHLLPALLLGCATDNKLVRRSTIDTFYQVPTDQVDILWVTDNSPSMVDEQAEVGNRFGSFIQNVVDNHIDFHIAIITTDMDSTDQKGKFQAPDGGAPILDEATPDYAGLFAQRIQLGAGGSDKEKGIDAALTALSEPLISGANAGFLREGATLSIIYLSDENDCTDRGALAQYEDGASCYDHSDKLYPIKDLIDEYKQIKQDGSRLLVSSIVGPRIEEGCEGAVPGFRYETMSQAFGGVQGDICEEDYSSMMEQLGLQVSGLLSTFQLSHSADPATILVEVDGVAVAEDSSNGWSYDTEYSVLSFHGTAIPPRGAIIEVAYDIIGG